MAFEVFQGGHLPEHTTVSGYSIMRLGTTPVVTATYAETINERLKVVVLGSEDMNQDGRFERLTVVLPLTEKLPVIGTAVETIFGVNIGSIAAISEIAVPETGPKDHRALMTLTGSNAGLLTSGSTAVLIQRTNLIGNTSHVPAQIGRAWTINLSSGTPAELAVINSLMIKMMMNVLAVGGQTLGVTGSLLTPDKLYTAAVTMAYQGITIDSIISEGLETVEKDRRAGSIDPTVFGNPPTAL